MIGVKKEKVRIIVGFGDISGFGVFYRRSQEDPDTQYHPIMDAYDDLVEQFVQAHVFKGGGDGEMFTIELVKESEEDQAIALLLALYKFMIRVQRLFKKSKDPKPDDYRIWLACGPVWKKTKPDGKFDYRGDKINLVSKLMENAGLRQYQFGVHESFRQLISPTKAKALGVTFEKITPTPPFPKSVEQKDMDSLSKVTIRFKSTSKKRKKKDVKSRSEGPTATGI